VRVFENRVLRRMCGPKRDEVAGGCIMKSSIILGFSSLIYYGD
jgi:hypothetical protein